MVNERPRAAAAQTCPGCGLHDQVQAVPAVWAAQRSTTRISADHYSPSVGWTATQGRAVTVTALGRMLAPPRPSTPWAILAAIGATGVCGFFELIALAAATGGNAPAGRDASGFLLVTTLVLAGCAALTVSLLRRRRVTDASLASARAHARARWERARYCARCHGVFVPSAAANLLTPARFAADLAAQARRPVTVVPAVVPYR
jgi:hypothetical protein